MTVANSSAFTTNGGPVALTDPTTGEQQAINSKGQAHVVLRGEVDANNTTTSLLGAGATFTGASTDVLDYAMVFVNVHADEASATDGLSVQQSIDGTDWAFTDEYTISAGAAKTFSFQLSCKYFRVVYTNGGTLQTHFDLSCTLKKSDAKASSHRIQDNIVDEDDAELVKAVVTGKDPDGTFRNVNTTPDGDLSVSDNSSGLAIAEGNVTGKSFIHKFGQAPDFDTGDGFVTVWDGAEDGEPYEAMNITYSTTADIDYLVAEDNSDTQLVEVQGLDASYALVTQTKTLTGNTPVALDTPLMRVFRMKNIGSTDFADHVFCYVSAGTTVTAGVPQDGAKVRAIVHNGNNQTEMAVYTIPAGKTGYMRDWYASTAGARRDSSHTIRVIARPFGQVFQLKHTANIDVNGTSYIKHEYSEPEVFAEKTDIEIRVNTDQNIASVAAGFDIVLKDN